MWHVTVTHTHTHARTVDWYHLTQPAKHRDHLRTTNQKADIISEFLLLSAQILPSIINKEKRRNMMGKGWGGMREGVGGGRWGGGVRACQRRPRLLQRSQDTNRSLPALSLSASVVLPQREGKNLIIELLKISLLAEAHLHVWEQPSRNPTWGRPFCARCEPLCHCTVAYCHLFFFFFFRNDQIKCLALLTPSLIHPLCGRRMIASITATELSRCDLKKKKRS